MIESRTLLGQSVLILEDDYYLAMDARAALEHAGATVIGPIADQPSAVAIAGTRTIHCAVLDIDDGAGPSFAAATAMRNNHVPIVFLTGYDRSMIPAEFNGARCLQKPVRDGELIDAVTRARAGHVT